MALPKSAGINSYDAQITKGYDYGAHHWVSLGIVAFIIIATAAEAADGCGRGWFYNGQRCVPQEEPGPRYYGPRTRYYEPEQPRYNEPEPRARNYEPEQPVAGPLLRFDLGGREESHYRLPTRH